MFSVHVISVATGDGDGAMLKPALAVVPATNVSICRLAIADSMMIARGDGHSNRILIHMQAYLPQFLTRERAGFHNRIMVATICAPCPRVLRLRC